MTLRTRFLAASATVIFVATSTLGVAQARSTNTSTIACAAVSSLETLCEIREMAQTVTPLRDAVNTQTMLRGIALVKAQWIWRVLRDM